MRYCEWSREVDERNPSDVRDITATLTTLAERVLLYRDSDICPIPHRGRWKIRIEPA